MPYYLAVKVVNALPVHVNYAGSVVHAVHKVASRLAKARVVGGAAEQPYVRVVGKQVVVVRRRGNQRLAVNGLLV